MTLSRRLLVSAALATVAAGCSTAPTAISDGVLTVTSMVGALRLANGSALPANYFLVAGDAAPLIDWIPCAGPTCPAIPGHGSVDVPHAQVCGFSASTTDVLTYWWHSVPDLKGGFRPDSIRVLVARL